jgi:hypothetical protein
MPSSYDGKSIEPAPFMDIAKEIQRNDAGNIRSSVFVVTIKGKLIAYRGSPNSTGNFHVTGGYAPEETIPQDSRFASLRTKIAALANLFAVDNKWYEAQPFDGSAPIKFRPRIRSINFAEGKWTEYVDYTIQMETNSIFCGDDEMTSLAYQLPEETWQYEVSDEKQKIYRISHTVSAQAKDRLNPDGTLDKVGWGVALELITPRLGWDAAMFSDLRPIPMPVGYGPKNYGRTQQIDETGGKVSITETWLVTYGNVQEDFSVNIRWNSDTGLTSAQIEGTVAGFSDPTNTMTPSEISAQKYARATEYYDTLVASEHLILLNRIQTYSGLLFNPIPLSKVSGKNPQSGVISYNLEYNNRVPNLIFGSLSENVNVSQEYPTDIFAKLVVLGRPGGPILQPIGTVTESTRTINVEVQMAAWNFGNYHTPPVKPDPTPLIAPFVIIGGLKEKDSESWNPRNGRYTRTVTYIWSV